MVYVDDMRNCMQTKFWPYGQACHLMADSVAELHEFAGRLKLKRSWFQDKSLPHYDLTAGMRTKAVQLGACEIDRHRFVELMRKNRPGKGRK